MEASEKIKQTKKRLEQIENALHFGYHTIESDDSKIVYRSRDDLNAIRNELVNELNQLENPNAKQTLPLHITARFVRGAR